MNTLRNHVVRSTCRLCHNSCGVLIHTKSGKPVRIEGDPSNPMSKGRLCRKGLASLEYLNHPDRLKHPLKRIGQKGKGEWREISWDEALETIADELKKAKEKYGPLSTLFIRGGSKGLSDDYLLRFANLFGTPNLSSPASVCYSPCLWASELTYGFYAYPDYEYSPKCIVVWGTNPETTCIPVYNAILSAIKRGSRLIVVDPIKNKLAERADVWIRLRPGTDLALALGMMNVIVNENLYDRNFTDKWTTGFEELKIHVQDYSPERVEEITWANCAQIREAARLYAIAKPGCIQWGNGIETNINSFQTCRAIAILRSITGNLSVPGGDLKWSEPGELVRKAPEFVCQDKIPANVRGNRLSIKDNLIPVFHYTLPQRMIKALLDEDPYPIRAAYLQGGNLLTSYPNAKETYKALAKLDFFVVVDMFLTPTAMLADIVLPVASYLEFDSVEQPWHYPIASVQQQVAKIGECWSDGKILNELSRRLGFKEYVWDDMKQPLDSFLKPAGLTFDEFRKIGVLIGTRLYRHFKKDGFDTPSKKAELYSKKLKEWGFDPLPIYYEPPETSCSEPQMSQEFPLILTSKKGDTYYHSGGRQIPCLRKVRPKPIIKIHHETASRLGIKEGDWVCITTKRGKIRQKANLVDRLDQRVVEVDYAWWFPEKGSSNLYGWEESNINILTDDKPPYNCELGSAHMRGIFCKVFKEKL